MSNPIKSLLLSVALLTGCSDDKAGEPRGDAGSLTGDGGVLPADAARDVAALMPPTCEAAATTLRACATGAPESALVTRLQECENAVIAYSHASVNPAFLEDFDRCVREPLAAAECQEAAAGEEGPKLPNLMEKCAFYAGIVGVSDGLRGPYIEACFFGSGDQDAGTCEEDKLLTPKTRSCVERFDACEEDEAFNHVDETCFLLPAALPNAFRGEFDACLSGSCAEISTCVEALIARRLPHYQ